MHWFQTVRRVLTREHIAHVTFVTLKWGNDHVPFGLRSVLGVVFVIGGVFGLLPVVGFWMLPLGVALIALDLPWTRHKVHDWMEKLEATGEPPRTATASGQDSATRNQ